MSLLALVFLALPALAQTPAAPEKDAGRKLWKLGLGYFAAGDADLAHVQWLACASLDPSNEECRQALAGLKKLSSAPVPAAAAPVEKPKEKEKKAAKLLPSPRRGEGQGEGVSAEESTVPQDREGRKDAAVLHWNAGTLQYQQGNLAKARDEWTLCNLYDPGNGDCLSGLNLLKTRIAAGASLTASATQPQNSGEQARKEGVRRWNAGILHYQKGDLEKARQEWLSCRKSDPSNLDCQSGLQRIERAQGAGP